MNESNQQTRCTMLRGWFVLSGSSVVNEVFKYGRVMFEKGKIIVNASFFVHEMKQIIEKQSRILHQVKRTMKKAVYLSSIICICV